MRRTVIQILDRKGLTIIIIIAMDDIPSWETLNYSLKFLFSKYEFDVCDIGQVQRLDYENMETIFYHLFLIIDPNGCRRVFRLLFPARNQDERAKFIDNMVIFINKKLHPDKVSSSRLRMCGGAPFRRLLNSLIMKAAEAELTAVLRRMSCDHPANSEVDDIWKTLDNERGDISHRLDILGRKRYQLEQIRETIVERRSHSEQLWTRLKLELDRQRSQPSPKQQLHFLEFDHQSSKVINRMLLDRIERTNQRCGKAAQKIRDISLPSSPGERSSPKGRQDNEKRLSYYVRELREKLTLSPEDPNGSKLVIKIHQQLRDYDDRVRVLLTELEEKQIEEDEALLKIPEVLEKYKQLEELLPAIRLHSISHYSTK